MMKLRLAAPQTLIDIADIEDLKGIKGWTAQATGGNLNVVIGALTTYRETRRSSSVFDGGLPRGGETRPTLSSVGSRPSLDARWRSSPTLRSAPAARPAGR